MASLDFNIIKNPISFTVQSETLIGTILSNKVPTGTPDFVFLHGAGFSTKEKIFNLANPIVKNGIDVLAFDFSGHGERVRSGDMGNTFDPKGLSIGSTLQFFLFINAS